MADAEIKRHWSRVAELGCLITGSHYDVTLHHPHGGSMLEVDGFQNPGWGQKSSNWLVIPLRADLHTGKFGIDNGQGQYKSVALWESVFEKQSRLVDEVCRRLGVNVWACAGITRGLS